MEHLRLDAQEYAPFHETYLKLVTSPDMIEGLRESRDATIALFKDITEPQMDFRYREGAWTLREMLQHIVDTERIFAYRALCISRGDQGPFPGFDHEAYVAAAPVAHLSKEHLLYDFVMGRNGHIALFEALTTEALNKRGEASGSMVSPRAFGYVMIGHCRHHLGVIQERYLS